MFENSNRFAPPSKELCGNYQTEKKQIIDEK